MDEICFVLRRFVIVAMFVGGLVHQDGRKYHTLDGLRGLAAFLVLLYHFPQFTAPVTPGVAGLAVDLFFMISGFVIALAYDTRLAAGMPLLQFMRIRLMRLYPLYLLGTLITVVTVGLAVVTGQPTRWSVEGFTVSATLALLMLPAPPLPGVVDLYPFVIPGWSLFYELVVNLLFGATHRYWTMKRLTATALVLAVVLVFAVSRYGLSGSGNTTGDILTGATRAGFSFTLGIVLLRLRLAGRLPAVPVPPALTLAAAFLLLMPQVGGTAGTMYALATILFAFPLIVIAAISVEPRHGRRLYTTLGVSSYAVYTLHEPIFRIVHKLDTRLGEPLAHAAPWSGMLLAAIVFVTALVADRIYDTPVRAWLGTMIKRRRQALSLRQSGGL